jgi:hypothetical protein
MLREVQCSRAHWMVCCCRLSSGMLLLLGIIIVLDLCAEIWGFLTDRRSKLGTIGYFQVFIDKKFNYKG